MSGFECDHALLARYLDGELTSDPARRIQQHISECSPCAAEVSALLSMKRSLRAAGGHFTPTLDFRRKIQQQVSRRRSANWNARLAWAVATLAIVLLLSVSWLGRPHRSDVFSEVADLHVGALAGASPVDVASTDRHTVKPWFQGRIPFSFDIPDSQDAGFNLLGGRMVYLNQHPGAQLIFTVGQHKISALVFQQSSVPGREVTANGDIERHNSFNVAAWDEQHLRFIVIGDANAGEMRNLVEKIKAANR